MGGGTSASVAQAGAAAIAQRRLVEREAARRRTSEVAQQGLEILWAKYGEPALAIIEGPTQPGVIDVGECLMAKVRSSRLVISDKPKSSLLGFCVPPAGDSPVVAESQPLPEGPRLRTPVSHIAYRFGGVVHAQTFGDTEPVVLP